MTAYPMRPNRASDFSAFSAQAASALAAGEALAAEHLGPTGELHHLHPSTLTMTAALRVSNDVDLAPVVAAIRSNRIVMLSVKNSQGARL